ncbi:MAG TPA: tRNA (N(6)-L-threonylcarbamoyladenosine(37)-C(2))-methylthiotransferase MtaB, partial [Nitrospirota bacterium]|nr:tRNA (N(6)-L-threonylcarbamoyladenosine(37)-C(2))-methylthiotransferase MtaB [Nitrospirota bacterium]
MRHDLAQDGNTFVPFDAEADVYVINTCSVTAKADAQCRQLIKAAAKRNQQARVVVTGCYAETRPDEIKGIPGVSLVLGNEGKSNIATHLGTGKVTANHRPSVMAV